MELRIMDHDKKQQAQSESRTERIEEAPLTSSEELLDSISQADHDVGDSDGTPLKDTVPAAAEWIELADAGPYIDETTVPLYRPNGDGAGGEVVFANERSDQWIAGYLARIGSKGVAGAMKARRSENTE
jgi:hypothetical protein